MLFVVLKFAVHFDFTFVLKVTFKLKLSLHFEITVNLELFCWSLAVASMRSTIGRAGATVCKARMSVC